MLIRNHTPFPIISFTSVDVEQREFAVIVVRGTFRLVPGLSGVSLIPHPEQEPIVEADRYHGIVGESSLRLESDLAPFKPKSDVHVVGSAWAPGGRRSSIWTVRARVGALEKTVRATGLRAWERRSSAWVLSAPEPCTEVPLRYEHSFGGIWRRGTREEQVFEANPVGIGFVGSTHRNGGPWMAPQLESEKDPVVEFGKCYTPQGFGPLARSWHPRRSLAGTFDAAWKEERWPALPVDFNFSHYNSAHPDLIFPGYLAGDERVELEGMHPSGTFDFRLPGYQPLLLLRLIGGALTATFLVLDTLHIDVPAERVSLTWRGAFPCRVPVRVVEVRMRRRGDG